MAGLSAALTPGFSLPDPVLQGTWRWIQDFVAEEKLCPWAPRARAKVLRLPGASQALCQAAGLEAEALLASQHEWPTTLMVCSHQDFAGAGGWRRFSRLCAAIQASQQ
ncbi:unnamed protein product, partial [Effrenium voratum]